MSEIVTHRRTRQLRGQLTDLNLRNLTTRERPYKVADGNGLHVLVSPRPHSRHQVFMSAMGSASSSETCRRLCSHYDARHRSAPAPLRSARH